MNKDYSHAYTKRNVNLQQEINVTKPKPRFRDRMDMFNGFFLPAAVAAIAISFFAWMEYLIASWTWQRWVQTVNTPTVQKSVMEGTYHHSAETDVVSAVIFGILSLVVIIACAYWAEDEYHKQKVKF